jgi:hypothetical protein
MTKSAAIKIFEKYKVHVGWIPPKYLPRFGSHRARKKWINKTLIASAKSVLRLQAGVENGTIKPVDDTDPKNWL